ncbi:TIM barrel protein [Cryptosporangium japonicum]|uniref:Hydroxypyruvate isomerase n=1 Tax=Cryptosporangium japonicum TaxID=80872 RepID=A0ABN0UF03_9ACTN
MTQLAPNIELLFTEAGELPDRVRAAAAAGFDAVEIWSILGPDLPSLKAVLAETGVTLTAALAEYPPATSFTWPDSDPSGYLERVERAVEAAVTVGCPRIVVAGGVGFPGRSRAANLDLLAEVFTQAVARVAGSGVTLVVEPVNTRVNHPGALLDRTADAVQVARAVDDDSFGVLYDLYHSVTEGEDPAAVLADAGALVKYVQIADVPGRGEPGTGAIDWASSFATLRAAGYDGPIGLEYYPTVGSAESVKPVVALAS